MIAIVVAYTTQGDLVGIFTCTPVRKFWNRPLPGTCINIAAYYYITIAMNILTDIAIIVIPIPALVKLNVPTNQKYGLIFAFGLGGFGCIMSIVRLHAISVSLNSPDPGESNATPAMWSVVEVHVCLICACLPSLRPVLLRIFPYASSFGSSNGQSAKRSQHHLTTTRKWTQGNGINRLSSNGGSVRIDDSERGLTEEVELEDVKSLNGGIQVISTSEVYSTRAPSGPTSRSPSSNSQVDLARPGGGDASWGYTVGVEAHHG
ncbi:putative pth11-like integral membrane protein [Neofusicoccum parvum]|uniref:Pth11-like integral membrane protein n=1 Tax=Neofusicoccum parvum TaxID=310453 RepID=A0ACB5SCI1_9PEZI|nr:putative pth11-like integral membrane protein [Neofusicoccum parvum]